MVLVLVWVWVFVVVFNVVVAVVVVAVFVDRYFHPIRGRGHVVRRMERKLLPSVG